MVDVFQGEKVRHLQSPRTPQLLEFLDREFRHGASYSTLNCTRSAIALISNQSGHDTPTVKRFLKGVSNLRPGLPKYNDTWDPQTVLTYFKKHQSTSLDQVARKLICLLALTTGQRIQSLQSIKVSNIRENVSEISIFIPDRIKTSGRGRNQPLLSLPFFSDPQICVARTLNQYLMMTRPFRGLIDHVFLTTRRTVQPATTQTLSRWIRDILTASGIDQRFKPHSTRHASTSTALKKGVPVDSIFKAAGWTSSSAVFARFYNRPIQHSNDAFALAVLNQ